MKRIFSKKSGFTLVEIVVAFAIFAIMSAMILSMIRLTVQTQSANNEFADSIEDQTGYLAYHYIDSSEKYDPTGTADGTFQMTFYDSSGNVVSNTSMDYAMRSSVGGALGSGEGINYFVGNTDYADANSLQAGGAGSEGDSIPGVGNSQAARYDTRISGSRNIDWITIRKVVKDTTYNVPGQTRYLIQCSAYGTPDANVEDDDKAYLQYKLRFCNKSYSEVEGVSAADGKTYMYKIYDEAKILDCGYINHKNSDGSLDWKDSTCVNYRSYTPSDPNAYSNGKNAYTVEPTSSSTVRIGVPINNNSYNGFSNSSFTTFYVVFSGDPQLTIDSFGSNSSSGKYTAYPLLEDDGTLSTTDYNLNIYGAYVYEKTLKAGS